jgi:hypothetical protein
VFDDFGVDLLGGAFEGVELVAFVAVDVAMGF